MVPAIGIGPVLKPPKAEEAHPTVAFLPNMHCSFIVHRLLDVAAVFHGQNPKQPALIKRRVAPALLQVSGEMPRQRKTIEASI